MLKLKNGCKNISYIGFEKPEKYGVAKTKKNKIIKIKEKPKKFFSDLAVTGLYFLIIRSLNMLNS